MFTFRFDFDGSPHIPNGIYTRNICRKGGFQGREALSQAFVYLHQNPFWLRNFPSLARLFLFIHNLYSVWCWSPSRGQVAVCLGCGWSENLVSDSQHQHRLWALHSSNPPHQAHQFLQHLQ